LHGKVWQRWGYRGGFCEKLLEASPCPTEAMPAGSKTDPALAKTKPVSDGGSVSGITHLRRGKKPKPVQQ